jgi:hypothetical protein
VLLIRTPTISSTRESQRHFCSQSRLRRSRRGRTRPMLRSLDSQSRPRATARRS